ncbi:hypothetical protein [Smaragdicoccus niigatensis]|uniref:hypothetical protein n=1 Tax=Smaragdicoccus niigatensis TaxID=359359 RepID=UPI00037F4F89|nr:hypothetical protein [Smaragdicoccus niigatensis]
MRAAVAVLCLLLGLLVGCGSEPPSGDVTDQAKPGDEVIVKALDTIFTWHPGTDASTIDGYRRAAPLLTQSLSDKSSAGSDVRPSAQWQDWARRKVSVNATTFIVAGEHRADTPDRIERTAVVTQTVVDPAASSQTLAPFNAYVAAVRTSAGWRVSDIAIR